MQFNKRGKKSNSNLEDNMSSSNTGSRMRISEQKSPLRTEKDSGDYPYGETLYIEPNDINFRRDNAMSPSSQEGYQSRGRSPNNLGQSVVMKVRIDLNERNDTAQVMSRSPLPKLDVNLEGKSKERNERSPKTINMGDNEIHYNLRTINERRSPKLNTSNNQLYQTYYNQNDPGNIFLDQPMQGYTSGQDQMYGYPGAGNQSMYQSGYQGSPSAMLQNRSGVDYINPNSREIQYSMNPRDCREPMPNIMNKMSPDKNIGDESNSDIKGNDTAMQLKDLKSQMDKNALIVRDGDGMQEGPRQLGNDMEKIEDYIKVKEVRETLTEGEVKKIMRQITRGYDPRKGTEGRLISTSQTIIPGGTQDVFNDRYRVLQKMNKLSTILLAKNRGGGSVDTSRRNLEDQKKTFDRNTLNSTITGKNRRSPLSRSPQNRFLYLSLAMISSKGPNCEDRIILRKMRFDKGGVVDLAQEDRRKKQKYKVRKIQKKAMPGGSKNLNYNPKYRDKAARVVQGWWRDLKDRYKKILDKIVLIQSVWRGRWLRKYIYDIIYLSFLHQRFCDIIEKVMSNNVRRWVWDDLFSINKYARECLYNLLEGRDEHFTSLRLRPYFERWKNTAKFITTRTLKSKNLINKREEDEQNKRLLNKYFQEWKLKANLLKYLDKDIDNEAQKRKFFGALSLLNGTKQLAQRAALDTVNPELQKYLASMTRERAVNKIIRSKPKLNKLLLRKYFQRWKETLPQFMLKDFKHQIFTKLTDRLDSRLNKVNLRKAFNTWKSKLPKDTLSDYVQGCKFLERGVFRASYKDPLKALSKKTDYENERDGILRMFGVKARYIKYHWKDYFNKWRNLAQRIKDKEIQNALYKSLLGTTLNKRRKRILAGRFYQWKQNPKVNMDDIFQRYKGLNNLCNKTVQSLLNPTKEDFLKRLKSTIHPKSFQRAAQRLFEKGFLKDRSTLRYYLYKWRDQCKNLEIYDLKLDILRYLCKGKDKGQRKNALGKAFNLWKLLVKDGKHVDYIDYLKRVNLGEGHLNKLYMKRILEFLKRMYRNLNKDYKPAFLKRVVNNLFKPRATVRDCFNKWRRANDIEKTDDEVRKFRNMIMSNNVKSLANRVNRETLLKYFNRWKNQARNPDDYYPRINEGLEKLKSLLKSSKCKEPFDKIQGSKNYNRVLIPLLKNNKNLQKRLDKDMTSRAFNKWRNNVITSKANNLRSNLLFKTKNNFLTKTKSNLLSKYFQRWKLYRPKKLSADFYKGLELLSNFCRRPFAKPILEAFKEKDNETQKTRAINAMFSQSKTFNNRSLRNAFNKWLKNMTVQKFQDAKQVARRNQLRHVVNRYDTSLLKYFTTWKVLSQQKRPGAPLDYTVDLLTKALRRGPFKEFIKNANMKNLTVPRGLNIRHALISNKNIAKSIYIRNISLRPYWRKWKEQANSIEKKEISNKIFSKIIAPKVRSMDRITLMRGFNTWRDNMKSEITKNKIRETQLKVMSYCCAKNKNKVIKKYFDIWLRNCNSGEKRDKNLQDAVDKLRKVAASKFLNKVRQSEIKNLKMGKVKTVMVNTFRNNDKGNLQYAFDKWRKFSKKQKELKLKAQVLKTICNSKDIKSADNDKSRLHEALLRWKINSTPDNTFDRMKAYNDGFKLLERATRRPNIKYVFNAMNNKVNDDYSKVLLHKLVKELGPKNELTLLRRAFNTWKDQVDETKTLNRKMENMFKEHLLGDKIHDGLIKDPVQDLIDAMKAAHAFKQDKAKEIADFCRGMLAIKEQFDKLKRNLLLKKRLQSLVNWHADKYHSAFPKWRGVVKSLENNENAIKIQRFIKGKLNTLLTKKGKFADACDHLTKFLKKRFLDSLRKTEKQNKFKSVVRKHCNNQDTLNGKMLHDAFTRWKSLIPLLQKDDAAKTIQNNFKMYLSRRLVQKLKQRNNRMRYMVLRLANQGDLKRQVAFNLWRHNAAQMKLNDSSNTVQDFMKDLKRKLQNRKFLKNRINQRKAFKILSNIKQDLKTPFDKIKSEANRKLLTKVVNDLDSKRKDHLKSAYDAIYNSYKDYLLRRLFTIPKGLENKILSKALDKWHDNAEKKSKLESAKIIQRCYNRYKKNKRKNRIDSLITQRIKLLCHKNSDKLNYYFNLWKKNVQKEKVLRAGKRIEKFLNDKYRTNLAARKWKKLADLLNMQNGNYAALRLMKKIKQYQALNKLSKPLNKLLQKEAFDSMKTEARHIKLKTMLKTALGSHDSRNDNLIKRKALKTWKDKAEKMKDREEALEKLVDTVDQRRKIIGAETLGSAFIVKKFAKVYPYIRMKEFLKRIQKLSDDQDKVREIRTKVLTSNKELLSKNRAYAINKLYQIFIYKKINKMFNIFQWFAINKIRPYAAKTLFEKLIENLLKNSYFNYEGDKKVSYAAPKTKFNFKNKATSKKRRVDKPSNVESLKKLMPHFVHYLDEKMKSRKREAFNKMIDNDRDGRFCTLFKKFSTKTLHPMKEELVSEMEERSTFMDTQGSYLISLFKLLRKKWIRHVKDSMAEPSKLYKLLYLMRITFLHKKVARHRFIRELVRKWRFATFVKKMARKKLELMYKNLHVSYLQMANEVFGDTDEINPSVIKEFERFGTSVGMFSNEEPSLNEEVSKKYYEKVQKRYVFKPTVIDEDIKKEVLDVERRQENEDYRIGDDGSETSGRYEKNEEDHK